LWEALYSGYVCLRVGVEVITARRLVEAEDRTGRGGWCCIFVEGVGVLEDECGRDREGEGDFTLRGGVEVVATRRLVHSVDRDAVGAVGVGVEGDFLEDVRGWDVLGELDFDGGGRVEVVTCRRLVETVDRDGVRVGCGVVTVAAVDAAEVLPAASFASTL
jgi:hypothetical protein